jgi:hypothetical protein
MAIWVLPVVAVAPCQCFWARRDPHDTTFPDLLDRTVPLPNPTGASRYDQRLTQRVGVPSRPSAGLERNAAAGGA